MIPTLPSLTSPPPSLLEIDSESQRSFREALQNESATVPVPSDSPSHLSCDRSHHTTSQGSRHQSWSLPQDVSTREMRKHVRSAQALAPVQPRSVRSQSSEDFIPERQSSNQARARTVESADELPTQRPRLENPASSIRWSIFDEPGLQRLRKVRKTCGLKQVHRCHGSSRLTITSGKTMGKQPACLKKSGMSYSVIPVISSQHTCVSVDRSSLA